MICCRSKRSALIGLTAVVGVPICPKCLCPYREGFKTCSDCGAELVDAERVYYHDLPEPRRIELAVFAFVAPWIAIAGAITLTTLLLPDGRGSNPAPMNCALPALAALYIAACFVYGRQRIARSGIRDWLSAWSWAAGAKIVVYALGDFFTVRSLAGPWFAYPPDLLVSAFALFIAWLGSRTSSRRPLASRYPE